MGLPWLDKFSVLVCFPVFSGQTFIWLQWWSNGLHFCALDGFTANYADQRDLHCVCERARKARRKHSLMSSLTFWSLRNKYAHTLLQWVRLEGWVSDTHSNKYFHFFHHSSASTCFLVLYSLSQWVLLTFTWSHYFERFILWIRVDYCLVVSGPCSCLYCSDRPLPNARRHATWQLLSLALHLSWCEAAVKPVWEVKRKQFWCLRSNTYILLYEKSYTVQTINIHVPLRLVNRLLKANNGITMGCLL